MRANLSRALTIVALTTTLSLAASPLPPPVQTALKAVEAMCTEVGGKPLSASAVKEVDVNADGKPDFVLDVASVNCEGAASVYGDREKGVTIFVADGAGGAAKAYDDVVYGVKIEGTKVWVTVAGDLCGKKPAPNFASESFCDRPLVWNAKTKKLELAPVSAVRMIQ